MSDTSLHHVFSLVFRELTSVAGLFSQFGELITASHGLDDVLKSSGMGKSQLSRLLKQPLQAALRDGFSRGYASFNGITEALYSFRRVVEGDKPFVFMQLDVHEVEQLRSSFGSSYDNLIEGVFQSDPKGGFLWLNSAMARMLGFKTAAECRDYYRDLGAEVYADPNERQPYLERLRREGTISNYETRFKRRDGSIFWARLNCRVVHRDVGEVVEGTIMDVDEQVRVRKQIYESESQYRALFRNNHCVMLIIDPIDGSIVDANPAAEKFYGYSRNELSGMFIMDLNTLSCDAIACEMDLAKQEKRRHFLFRHRLASGDVRDVEVYSGPIVISGREVLYSIIHDVTDAKRQQDHNALLSEALEQSLNAFELLRDTGEFLYVNRAYLDMWGYDSLEEVRGTRPEEHYMNPDVPQAMLKLIGDCSRYSYETIAKRKTGECFDVLRNAFLHEDSMGNRYQVASSWDVSETKNYQKSLVKAKEAAEAASRAKSEFLANMSHEIRTPLNGIMGMLQLMQITRLTEEQEEYADIALNSSRGLLQVLNDLLDFSRIEAGRLVIADAPFSLKGMLGNMERMFRPQFMEKGIEFKAVCENAFADVLVGDEGRLRQILFNLVGNSLKFTKEGFVKVEAYPLWHPDSRNVRLYISVQDTGIGISEDMLSSVFESFQQVEGTYSKHYHGVGLGLSIVRKLVHLMDGTIAVESTLGEGTTITVVVTLGVAESDMRMQNVPTADFAKTTQTGAVLVVEDEHVNRLMARRILEKMGYCVECAENGLRALEILRKQRFDIVFLDIQMPVMDGLETLHRLRTKQEYLLNRNVPVVALTAHALNEDRKRILSQGVDEFLAKPMEIKDLKTVLGKLMNPIRQ